MCVSSTLELRGILGLRRKYPGAHKAFTSCCWRNKSAEMFADKGCAGIMGDIPFLRRTLAQPVSVGLAARSGVSVAAFI